MIGRLPFLLTVMLFAATLANFGQAQDTNQRECNKGQEDFRGPGFDPTPVQIPPSLASPLRPITSMDLLTLRDLRGVHISPDGKSVAFVVSQAMYKANSYRTGLFVAGTEPGSKPMNLGSAGPPRWDEIGQYPLEPPSWSPDSRYITYRLKRSGIWQVWCWNRSGGEPLQLTHSPYDVQSFEWSPDGRKILFVVQKPRDSMETRHLSERGILYDGNSNALQYKPVVEAELDKKPKDRATWIYDIGTGEERIASPTEERRGPWQRGPNDRGVIEGKISPDGKLLAYTTLEIDAEKSAHERYSLFVRPLSGGESIELAPGAYFVADFWWSADGSRIYFVEYSEDLRPPKLLVVPVRGGAARQILQLEDSISRLSVDERGTLLACVRENSTTPEEVALVDLKTGAMRTLAIVNPEFQNIQLSPATRVEWKNRYGENGFGYLVKPLKYEPGKTYPLIVTTYRAGGFLRGAVGDEYPIQVFAANGFAVLVFEMGAWPNVRKGDFQGAMRMLYPIASLGAALKVLNDMGISDAHRRGVTGLSFGAGIVELAISHSDLFHAAIASGPGARDPFAYYFAGKQLQEQFGEWGLRGWPEGEASASWHELSPALNAGHIRTPLLVNVADSEFRAGLQLYASMQQLHKPLEVFIYSDEGHIKNQPKHRLEIYNRNLDWFRFWLKNEEDPDPAKAEQYKRWRELKKMQTENQESNATESNLAHIN